MTIEERLMKHEPMRRFWCPAEFWPALGYEGNAPYVAIYWEQSGDEASWSDGRMSVCGAGWPAYLALMDYNFPIGHPIRHRFGSSEDVAEAWLVIHRDTQRAWIVPPYKAEQILQLQWPERERVVIDFPGFVNALQEMKTWVPDMEVIEAAMKESERRFDAFMKVLDAQREYNDYLLESHVQRWAESQADQDYWQRVMKGEE